MIFIVAMSGAKLSLAEGHRGGGRYDIIRGVMKRQLCHKHCRACKPW